MTIPDPLIQYANRVPFNPARGTSFAMQTPQLQPASVAGDLPCRICVEPHYVEITQVPGGRCSLGPPYDPYFDLSFARFTGITWPWPACYLEVLTSNQASLAAGTIFYLQLRGTTTNRPPAPLNPLRIFYWQSDVGAHAWRFSLVPCAFMSGTNNLVTSIGVTNASGSSFITHIFGNGGGNIIHSVSPLDFTAVLTPAVGNITVRLRGYVE